MKPFTLAFGSIVLFSLASACGTDDPENEASMTDHRYQDFKAFPDGSVAYPSRGSGAQAIRIARVMPCDG